MGRKSAKYYRSIVTVWKKGEEDEFGRVGYSAPLRVMASFEVGVKNKYTDNKGIEFVPSSRVWTEFRDADGVLSEPPRQGDLILLEESFDNTPPNGAYSIRNIITHDNTILEGRNSVPDYEVMTG